jgi:plastocyanin
MRKTLLALSALALFATADASATSTHAAQTRSVTVGDDFFSKGSVTIPRGGTVRWTWKGSNDHSVTDRNGRFDSKVRTHGSYRHKFTRSGTYSVYCVVHPDDMNMTVVVK